MKSQTTVKVYLRNLKFFINKERDKISLKYIHQKGENQKKSDSPMENILTHKTKKSFCSQNTKKWTKIKNCLTVWTKFLKLFTKWQKMNKKKLILEEIKSKKMSSFTQRRWIRRSRRRRILKVYPIFKKFEHYPHKKGRGKPSSLLALFSISIHNTQNNHSWFMKIKLYKKNSFRW